MSTTIKLRRSAIPGRIPTTAQLDLGELAINTADGKIYFKRYDPAANTESIIDISSNLDAAAILEELLTVDGAGTGLDSDLLDGEEGSYYLDYNNFTNVPPATLDLVLDGKVTGTAFSNTGVMTLTTELANTGVIAGSYGSASEVPVFTVDEDGRLISANTVSVAGVDNTTWETANNTFTIGTADGSFYHTVIEDFNDITANNGLFTGTLNVIGSLTVLGDSDTGQNANTTGDLTANNGVFFGNITVNGLVDGRDVAADGAKLDLLEDGLDLTLTGKVTGTASSNTGVMTLTTELANTGVTSGVYGSSTEIPVFTVDEDGRLTTANTTPVAGVDDFTYDASNNQITLTTGDGSSFSIQTETEVTLTGKVTGTATATDGNLSIATQLENTGVTANTYGSSTAIPVFTVDEDGRITLASTASVAGVNDLFWTPENNTLTLETGDGSSYLVPISEFNEITANTINGRDITADGTKLDGIEDNATADQTPAEILAALLTVDGDGSGLDADSVDGYSASEILDAAANNVANLIGAGDVTISANTGVLVTGDSTFNLNSANNFNITIEHADTSTIANTSFILPEVLTGVTFDTFGHVQSVSSTNLDTRYYTETEADAKFVDVTGDTMSGDLTVNAKINQSHSSFVSETTTTTAATQTAIYTFPYGSYDAAELTIKVKEGSKRHITKLLITHDGATPIATEYGTVFTTGELAEFNVQIDAQFLQLLATPSSANSTEFKIVGTLII